MINTVITALIPLNMAWGISRRGVREVWAPPEKRYKQPIWVDRRCIKPVKRWQGIESRGC